MFRGKRLRVTVTGLRFGVEGLGLGFRVEGFLTVEL